MNAYCILSNARTSQRLMQNGNKNGRREDRSSIHLREKKSYVLPMFAYPSGSLHMGHLRVYTISDVIARYRRMIGYGVLHPTGWDAFGLPAENAAIERGISPATWTEKNIASMKVQLKSMNTSFDWESEISTCSPSFYKHTQHLFLMLFQKGLAYQADALVNYDPVDKTVLANEQVDSNGRSWRSGAVVQQINLKQWFFRITAFRETLLEDLDFLSKDNKWPDRVISQQRNWLGRSQGAKIRFELEHDNGKLDSMQVYTTRPETLFGVKYIALSLSHPVVQQLAPTFPELQEFLAKRATFTLTSRAGFELPLKAYSPLSKLSDDNVESLPVYAAPYILEGYGEGAVMGVPGHDSRDLAFWKANRPLGQIPLIIAPPSELLHDLKPSVNDISEAYTDPGILTSLCGPYEGLENEVAAVKIVNDLQAIGLAQPFETWKLRDWLISRQRYWGTPIPIIHCRTCGVVPVPVEELPVELPTLDDSIKGQRGNPLEEQREWVNCDCPHCHGPAKRETDTMDTFVDSSWYFLRFTDPMSDSLPFSHRSGNAILPVDTYVGGVEHAILHLLYARFMYKFLSSEGLIQGANHQNEPFQQLIAQGMVHGKTFSDPTNGRFLIPEEIDYSQQVPIVKASQQIPLVTWEKMSKSKYNGVDPASCIQQYGADATRAHILFAAPVGEVLQWDEEKIVGIQRWFGRIGRLIDDYLQIDKHWFDSYGLKQPKDIENLSQTDADALLLTHNIIKSVSQTFDHDIYSLNTTISDLIKLTNGLCELDVTKMTPWVAQESVSTLLRMLAPIAPAFMEECWEIGKFNSKNQDKSIFECGWPRNILSTDDEAKLMMRRKEMTCAVQINGKLRFTVQVPLINKGAQDPISLKRHESQVIKAVLASKVGKLWLTEKFNWDERKKTVIVRGGKLLNIVF